MLFVDIEIPYLCGILFSNYAGRTSAAISPQEFDSSAFRP